MALRDNIKQDSRAISNLFARFSEDIDGTIETHFSSAQATWRLFSDLNFTGEFTIYFMRGRNRNSIQDILKRITATWNELYPVKDSSSAIEQDTFMEKIAIPEQAYEAPSTGLRRSIYNQLKRNGFSSRVITALEYLNLEEKSDSEFVPLQIYFSQNLTATDLLRLERGLTTIFLSISRTQYYDEYIPTEPVRLQSYTTPNSGLIEFLVVGSILGFASAFIAKSLSSPNSQGNQIRNEAKNAIIDLREKNQPRLLQSPNQLADINQDNEVDTLELETVFSNKREEGSIIIINTTINMIVQEV